jgi:broad specificity phosphatase PhoE
MKLIFVRHGQSEANAQGILAGQEIDSPLTEKGQGQARAAREKLTMHMDRIVSSPMRRAADTAAIINEKLGLPIEYNDKVKEISNGSLSSHSWTEAAKMTNDPDFVEHDRTCSYDYSPFGGESAAQAKVRIKAFVDEMLAAHPSETILVTAHSGVINAMHALYPQQETWDDDNAAIHEFDF